MIRNTERSLNVGSGRSDLEMEINRRRDYPFLKTDYPFLKTDSPCPKQFHGGVPSVHPPQFPNKHEVEQVQGGETVITISTSPRYSFGETNERGELINFAFIPVKPDMYRAIKIGDIDGFRSELTECPTNLGQVMISPRGNTILHIAASLGHGSMVDLILNHCPGLVMIKNCTGDLALHLAAAAGRQSIVESLVRQVKHLQGPSCGNGRMPDLLVEVNDEKNTALHLAMKNHHYEMAQFLVEMNSQVSVCPNSEEVSPLYMAAEAGHLELVKLMMENRQPEIRALKGKSLVHAAIRGRNIDVLDAVMRCQATDIPTLDQERGSYDSFYYTSFHEGPKTSFCSVPFDEEGRTALSFASSIGYLDGVRYFLDKSSNAIYVRDSDGFFPIHRASMRGQVRIMEEFLGRCPDLRELLNKGGQNILHVAAQRGKAIVVNYVLKSSELEMLINERDRKGNTPLHLATKGGHARVVSIMTWDKRVNLELINDKGRTALDAAENYPGKAPSYQMRLSWLALRYAGAPRAKQRSTSGVNMPIKPPPPGMNVYKDRVNTLLLVATLVATVTFAAGFTMPGGYNSSDHPYQGMATLVEKRMFHVFLISNTIAMYSSIGVAILLIWAMLNDTSLGLSSLKLAFPLLGISLSMVSLAFMAAIYLVVSNVTWLATVVLIIGSISLITLLMLFVPLSFPNSLKHRAFRYILYYPFCLLILATEKKSEDDTKE